MHIKSSAFASPKRSFFVCAGEIVYTGDFLLTNISSRTCGCFRVWTRMVSSRRSARALSMLKRFAIRHSLWWCSSWQRSRYAAKRGRRCGRARLTIDYAAALLSARVCFRFGGASVSFARSVICRVRYSSITYFRNSFCRRRLRTSDLLCDAAMMCVLVRITSPISPLDAHTSPPFFGSRKAERVK